jgi:hypothetical protein
LRNDGLYRLGSWTGDQIPWVSFWAFLLASVAGNLQDTIILGIQVGSDQDQMNVILFTQLLDFLTLTDGQAPPHVIAAIKDFLKSVQG